MEPNYGYKHTKGFLIFILFVIAMAVGAVYAQTSTTPNLVVNGYTNTYNSSNLNCWQPGDSYCSPNGQPYYNPNNGNINFSYGMWDIYQYRNVNTVLPSGGTGLVITGWHLQYTAKVGNNWDDARYDYLRSYVNIIGRGGQVIEQANFVHTNTHNWYTFHLANNYNPLTTRYTTDNFTRYGFGFIGQDYNGWVGPYGPEIMNVSFTLNYQPDPCLRSQLISPQCPGFLDAVQKVGAIPKQENPMAQEAAVAAITPATLVNAQETKKVEAPVAIARKGREEIKLSAFVQEINMPAQETQAIQTQQTTTTALVEQTRSIQQARGQTTRSSNQIQMDSTQLSTTYSTDNSQLEQMLAAPAKSIEPVQTVSTTTSQQQRESPVIQTVHQGLPNELTQPIQIEQPKVQVEVASIQSTPLYTPPNIQQLAQPIRQELTPVAIEQPVLAKAETQAQEVSTALPTNMLTDKTNPVNDIVTAQPQMPTMATFTGPTVNQKQQDNDLAGGVSIARMAVVPAGFDAYNVALRDVAFYAPREIYRNQKTVDNVRALRKLASDRLHQQMVDQQYLSR